MPIISLIWHPFQGRAKPTTTSRWEIVLIIVVDDTRTVLVRLGNSVLLREVVLLTPALRIKVRPLSLAANPDSVPAVRRESIGRRVVGDAVIPEGDVTSLPLEPGVQLGAGADNLIEERDDVVGFRLGHTNNLGHEARVKEQRFPAGDRVSADQWMLGGDGLATDGAAQVARTLCLEVGGVQRSDGLKVLLHEGREHVVCCIAGGPQGIAATAASWAGEDLERGVGRRLDLVSHLLPWLASCMLWFE